MKTLMKLTMIVFFWIGCITMNEVQAQTNPDTLTVYREIHIDRSQPNVGYRVSEDNPDGSVILAKDVKPIYKSRMAALKVYTSQRWEVVNVYYKNGEDLYAIYLLKRTNLPKIRR